MTVCKQCGAEIGPQGRARGRSRVFCGDECRIRWQSTSKTAQGNYGVSANERSNELRRRHEAIHSDPDLRAHLDRLRCGPVLHVPMAWRFEQMRRARAREERRGTA